MSHNADVIFETGRCDDATASIQLKYAKGNLDSLGVVAGWEGAVRGPVCRYSRTLAADFPLSSRGSVVITEPCYWTPAMPFLYNVVANVAISGGAHSVECGIGLRRLETRGESLFLDGRRIVLRGTTISTASDDLPLHDFDNLLMRAREEESALVVRGYDDALCFSAAEKGVPLVVDLRDDKRIVSNRLPTPAEQPAVVAWIVAESQAARFHRLPGGALLAVAIGEDARSESAVGASLFAVELDGAATPPAWLAEVEKPVIALRPTGGRTRIAGARQRAGALQADLAPAFDLAGYFA